jgi:hypothetical protein
VTKKERKTERKGRERNKDDSIRIGIRVAGKHRKEGWRKRMWVLMQ